MNINALETLVGQLQQGASKFSNAAQTLRQQAQRLDWTAQDLADGVDAWAGNGSKHFQAAWQAYHANTSKSAAALDDTAQALTKLAQKINDSVQQYRAAQAAQAASSFLGVVLVVADVAQLGLDPVTDAATAGDLGVDAAATASADAAAEAIAEADAEIGSELDEIISQIEDADEPGNISLDPGNEPGDINFDENPADDTGGNNPGGNGDNGGNDGGNGNNGNGGNGSDGDGGDDPERQQRLDKLAQDPAHGGKITPGSQREAEVGLGLEESGELPGPIQRDPSGASEFIDADGQSWDVKQFHSEMGRFDLSQATTKISGELRDGENVILDAKYLSPEDISSLMQVIEENGWQERVLWYFGS